ncbi:hypothetical protein V1J52_04070 [Streptomyces sp. TRM 70351]|uniref:hypothetical protein n=1 Tax=Streptomyces sp. TRM 70351 TaxID=3116552 RepID=UPI002E7AF4A5|nr:hypothetical protein [Streptomyces sp. TRM 70351]MEE1927366.1 hypothetical protein [Streptomyces sp. TRM 70351]
MITLMTYGGAVAADTAETRTGGVPLVPDGFRWPPCANCGEPMQFLAQLRLDAPVGDGNGVLALFMCDAQPGLCEQWDPWDGGNRAVLLPADGVAPAVPPDTGVTRLGAVSGVRYERVDAPTYFDASEEWAEVEGRTRRGVLGQWGGEPEWLQGEETPACPGCGEPMGFVAQLEEGRDHTTAANFGGGGCAYAFVCGPCARAAFLWQC